MGGLSNLEYVRMYENQLSGTLPAEIGNLDNLVLLFLYNNQLTGSVPEELGSIPSLSYLYIENNRYTFYDLEPMTGNTIEYFDYSPQRSVKCDVIRLDLSSDENIDLDITELSVAETEATNNEYRWRKDGAEITEFITSPVFSIENASNSDQGYYYCIMKNSDFPELLLYTDSILLMIDAPSNIVLDPFSIDENSAAGTTVGSLSTTDPDQEAGHTYELIEGDGSIDADNDVFSIIGTDLIIGESPDYETQQEYHIYLRVTDEDLKTFEKTFTIYVNDLTETATPEYFAEFGLKIFPNPFQSEVNIDFPGCLEDEIQIALFSIHGKMIFSERIFGYTAINTENLPEGIYFLRVKTNSMERIMKLVKR